MAANGVAKADASLAVGLRQVEPALAAWRQRRRHREAIPEELWRLIVPLARAHGVSPVAQALGLNYTTLKERTLLGETVAPARNRTGGFLEVPVIGWPAAAACRAWARPISPPPVPRSPAGSGQTAALLDMFCALKGATRTPRRA